MPRHLSESGASLSRSLDHLDVRSRGSGQAKVRLEPDSLLFVKDENVRLGRELAEGTQRIARLQRVSASCLRRRLVRVSRQIAVRYDSAADAPSV